MASGIDPSGFYLSAETLFDVIAAVADVAEDTRQRAITAIRTITVAEKLVDSFQLGGTLVNLMDSIENRNGVIKIMHAVKDLDKVPIVNIKGTPVN